MTSYHLWRSLSIGVVARSYTCRFGETLVRGVSVWWRQHRQSVLVLVEGQWCGARQWQLFGFGVDHCDGVNDLLDEGCGARRRPVLKET
jgi:hypothetical protein